jgi:hypothetical protein
MFSKIGLRRAALGGFAAFTLAFIIVDAATPAAAECGYGDGYVSYASGYGYDDDGYQPPPSYPRPAIGGYRRRPVPAFVEGHVARKAPVHAAHPAPVVPPLAATPAPVAPVTPVAAAPAPVAPPAPVDAAAPAPAAPATPVDAAVPASDASTPAPVAVNKDQASASGCTLADKTRVAAANDAGSRSLIVSACK